MYGNPHRDELPVTVKVINSTEDNEPGEVKFSNRVPEVAIRVDGHVRGQGRARQGSEVAVVQVDGANADDSVYPAVCPAAPADERYFIDTHPGLGDTRAWVEIDGATSATYTPGYDEDSGGTSVPTDTNTWRP